MKSYLAFVQSEPIVVLGKHEYDKACIILGILHRGPFLHENYPAHLVWSG